MINYSIIIPHKNIPALLQRCLDSIPRREDVQIIVVDDNSDTDKVDFANFPGLNDPFVEVIFGKNENGRKGAGYARNLGLECAKGKWLLFADADDYFLSEAFAYFDEYVASEYDIIYWNRNNFDTYFSLLDEDILRYQYYAPWSKMIRRSLVEKNCIRFEEVIASNDIMFSVKIGFYANRIVADNRKLYFHVFRKGSLVNTISPEIVKARLIEIVKGTKFLNSIGKGRMAESPRITLWLSLHCGIKTFLWSVKTIVVNRLPLWTGFSFKRLFRYFSPQTRLVRSTYKVYQKNDNPARH